MSDSNILIANKFDGQKIQHDEQKIQHDSSFFQFANWDGS
jgi:hypothetical protein